METDVAYKKHQNNNILEYKGSVEKVHKFLNGKGNPYGV